MWNVRHGGGVKFPGNPVVPGAWVVPVEGGAPHYDATVTPGSLWTAGRILRIPCGVAVVEHGGCAARPVPGCRCS